MFRVALTANNAHQVHTLCLRFLLPRVHPAPSTSFQTLGRLLIVTIVITDLRLPQIKVSVTCVQLDISKGMRIPQTAPLALRASIANMLDRIPAPIVLLGIFPLTPALLSALRAA